MQTSGIIDKKESADKIEMIDNDSSTAITYRRCIGGKLYFMKKLRPELCSVARYLNAFHKDNETGKSIKSPYIVGYHDIKDDSDGLYILMEYIQGATLKEKLKMSRNTLSAARTLKSSYCNYAGH